MSQRTTSYHHQRESTPGTMADAAAPTRIGKSNSNGSIDATARSIQNGLIKNLKLQADLASRIERVATAKAKNRALAGQVRASMCHRWKRNDVTTTEAQESESAPAEFYTRFAEQLKKQEIERIAAEDTTKTNEESLTKKGQSPAAKYKPAVVSKRWSSNPNRRWTRRFFVDPDGSVPEPNADTIRRREADADIPFFFRSPYWSKDEIELLRTAVEIVRKEQTPTDPDENGNITSISDDQVDFEKVARVLKEKQASCSKKTKSQQEKSTFVRSADDCRVKYLSYASPSLNFTKFSKEENLKILELVHLHNGNPRWDDVARTLGGDRTAWHCFCHFQRKLNSNLRSRPWTPEEDELLLKYTAAMGPRFTLNMEASADMAVRFFPDRSAQQVLQRAHWNLVNPNFDHGPWDQDEERRLALYMKVYRDSPSPLTFAARHFPNRSGKSVYEKWTRALNPEYASKPFTEKEDEELLAAVEKAGGTDNFASIAKLFPDRKTRSLVIRWEELAKDEDLSKKINNSLVKRSIARAGTVGETGEALLSPDDFVVRLKPSARKSAAKTNETTLGKKRKR